MARPAGSPCRAANPGENDRRHAAPGSSGGARPDLERSRVMGALPDVPSAAPAPDAPATALPAPSALAPTPPETRRIATDGSVTLPRYDAAYLKNPPPAYPAASRRQREQGRVLMRVRVSAEGTAGEVSIERKWLARPRRRRGGGGSPLAFRAGPSRCAGRGGMGAGAARVRAATPMNNCSYALAVNRPPARAGAAA